MSGHGAPQRPTRPSVRGVLRAAAVTAEHWWDRTRLSRVADQPPAELRIVTYLGHGAGPRVAVRGRVLDGTEPPAAAEGEGTRAAVRRTLASFLTDELPGVPLRVRLGDADVETVTDDEGYFDLTVAAGLDAAAGPWAEGQVELAGTYRGLEPGHGTPLHVRIPGRRTSFGVISDVDDTILYTGAQRALEMLRQTFAGSALTRSPLPGAPELYRGLARGLDGRRENPVFYVSSSPWNLHGFLTAFLEHRDFPAGPLLLRDLLGGRERRSHLAGKGRHIEEILDLHPDLQFVLIGDSGQHDPEIYADVARRHPGRILAIYIREVRLDPGDGRVEAISDGWDHTVPFVLAHDSAAVAQHAADLRLLSATAARAVGRAVGRAVAESARHGG